MNHMASTNQSSQAAQRSGLTEVAMADLDVAKSSHHLVALDAIG